MATTYNNLYLDIRQQLRRAGIEEATLEARELVCFGTNKSREELARILREYGEEYSRSRFIKRLRSATYETLRDEARRQQRGSSDVAHALAVTKLYNLTGGRGTVDPRRLTVLD